MIKPSTSLKLLLGLVSTAFLAMSAAGDTTIYDNSGNDLVTRLNPGLKEIGDEVVFAGTDRFLKQFDFEYYGLNSANNFLFSGNVQARVRFYLNDGPTFNGYATPGTSFFDSGWIGGFGPTSRNTLVFASVLGDFPSGGLYLPANSITWSVQFQGLGATDEVGVDIYNPLVVGQNYNDYWEKNGANWSLLTGGVPMNFAARFVATVPEPTTLTLLAVVGFGLLASRSSRKV